MATNGPNGNIPNGNINFNSNPSVQPGIFGYAQGQSTRREFTNDFWKEGGYLSESIKELEEMKRQYKEMSKEVSNLSKSEQKTFKDRKQALNQQLALLKTIRENQETSDTEAIEAINSSNKLRLKGQQDLIKLLNSIIENQDKADQQHLDNLDAAVEKYNQIKQTTDETGQKLKQTTSILNKASDSWSESLSKTLNTAGDKLSDIINMFNIQSLANNAAEQNARSKAAIMGNVSRQFGFSSNAQFESFKNSLNDTIKDMNKEMGNLFNAEDMQQYMANLSAYGVTDTKMAEQQMKSSILATKYLGVSTETQTMIFKYMKQTNNNEALEEHNQRIVGLLKSQLGVSKEQLDVLSQQNYTAAEALTALGKDQDTIDRYLDESGAVTGALSSINESYGTAMGQLFTNIVTSSYDEVLAKYGTVFGNQTSDIYTALTNGEVYDAFKMMLSSKQLQTTLGLGSNLSEDDRTKTQSIVQRELGIADIGGLSNMAQYFSENGFEGFDEKFADALESIQTTTNKDVENYVEQTQEATFLESIWNWISTNLNGIPWKWTMNLANLAFTAYLASGAVNLAGKIGDFLGKGNATSGFWGGLNKFLGKGSALASSSSQIEGQLSMFTQGKGTAGLGLSKLAGVAGGTAAVVGLTAATVALIGSAVDEAINKSDAGNISAAESQLQGTGLEGNNSAINISGQAMTDDKENNNGWTRFSTGYHQFTTGIGSFFKKTFQNDLAGLNANEYKLFRDALRANGGGTDYETIKSALLAWRLLLDSAGRLTDLGTNETTEDLKALINSGEYGTQATLNNYARYISNEMNKAPYKTKNERQTTIDWDKYAKNGIPWVPRDNYLINAHKGEMLLTADEAKAYRNMLMPKNAGDVREGFYSVDDGRRGGNYPYPITSAWNEARDGGRHHTGVDFGMSQGTPIGASIPGKVASASYNGGYGNLVVVQAGDGKRILYAHQSKMAVKAGQQINAGTLIGYVGSTGNSTGPHLHFEVRRTADYGTDIDPLPYVTNSLFNVGDSSGAVLSSSTDNFNDAQESDGSVQVRTRRFVPKAFTGNMGGDDGPGRIVNSVDGGFNKLISYLDSIRDEQVKQRALLNAFSKSRIPESTF